MNVSEGEAETRVDRQKWAHNDRQTARTSAEETTTESTATAERETGKTESRKYGAARQHERPDGYNNHQ